MKLIIDNKRGIYNYTDEEFQTVKDLTASLIKAADDESLPPYTVNQLRDAISRLIVKSLIQLKEICGSFDMNIEKDIWMTAIKNNVELHLISEGYSIKSTVINLPKLKSMDD